MKKLSFLFIAFIGISAFSQNQIKGVINDAATGEFLPTASIYLPQIEKGTTSDDKGAFELNNLPGGNVKIIISMLGYETATLVVNVSDLKEPLSIHLKPSVFEMNEVIVSTPFQQLQKDNVMKVERSSIETLQKNGGATLSDRLTSIPGVSSITTGLSVGKPVIRGLSANRVLVYTQGVRLENQQFGDEHGLGLSDAGVESVEVIKGPASLLYGSDALGGVLYFNPESFAIVGKQTADASFEYVTNTEGVKTNVGYKVSGESLKFIIRGSQSSHADYKIPNGDFVTNSRFNELDLKSALGYSHKNFKTNLRYNYNRFRTGVPEEIGAQSRSKSMQLPFQDIDNHIISSESSLFLDKSSFDLKLGYIYNNRKELGESDVTPELGMRLNTFNYDLKYNLPKLGKFQTIVGLQGMYQDNENFGEESLIPNAVTKDIGVVITSLYSFKNNALQFGLRVDNRNIRSQDKGEPNSPNDEFVSALDRSYTSFNAALGYKTEFLKKFIGRLNIASGSRSPNLAELTSNGVHEGTNRFEIGSANLDKENNIQTDLSIEFANEHVEFAIDGFYNAINNYIFILPENRFVEGNQVFNFTQNDAHLYGGEITFHFHPHPLDWMHWESSYETVLGKINGIDDLPLIPANTISNTLRIEFQKVGFLKNTFAFVKDSYTFEQNKVSPFETTSDSYNLVSAGLGGSFDLNGRVLNLTVSGTNLFGETYIPHLSRLKTDEIPNVGRNVNIKLSYLF